MPEAGEEPLRRDGEAVEVAAAGTVEEEEREPGEVAELMVAPVEEEGAAIGAPGI